MSISKRVDDHNITGIALVNANAHQCNSCGVVIIDMLADQHCFLLFRNEFATKCGIERKLNEMCHNCPQNPFAESTWV